MFALPSLPYRYDGLAPVISERSLRLHYDTHHGGCLEALNALLAAPGRSPRELEEVIAEASQAGERQLLNCAAQVWNHSFFWAAMSTRVRSPKGALALAIAMAFGDLAGLKSAFVSESAAHFGPGWIWLVANEIGCLRVFVTRDGDNTLREAGFVPLLACDLWEHAYYLDHEHDRRAFLDAWFDALPNWDFAARQYATACGRGAPWRHPAPVDDVTKAKVA